MTDDKKLYNAVNVYKTICDSLDAKGLNYNKEEDKLFVFFGIKGSEENIPLHTFISVDVDRQLVRLDSVLPFKMNEDKRVDGAIATGAANFGMVDGNFDYDMSDGTIRFSMTVSFIGSLIGEGLIDYLIGCSCYTVDKYNDKFYDINEGKLSVADFIENE
ncbi:MAG: hypothetical protein IJ946_01735 [Clostridia bacterium]|nr:hypothetical protein [Clostridia bacterium]